MEDRELLCYTAYTMPQQNQTYWNNIAKEYDKNVSEKGDIRHEKIINPVVFELLGDLRNKAVLDAGCGNGYFSRKIAKKAQKVIGIDFTYELIQKAKRKNSSQNIEFIEGDLEHLPFPLATFDVILCNMVLMDVERLNKVVSEFNRVVKTKGIIIISIIHPCFENPPRTYSLFDGKGIRIGSIIQKYFETGLVKDEKNKINNEPYQHYHYMISDYLNSFTENKLYLEKMVEPNGFVIDKSNEMGMNSDAPTFLVMKFVKRN